jgi:hypothetical protein
MRRWWNGRHVRLRSGRATARLGVQVSPCAPIAGIAQWQSSTLVSCRPGSDSPRQLHHAAVAHRKSARPTRERQQVRFLPAAPSRRRQAAQRSHKAHAGRLNSSRRHHARLAQRQSTSSTPRGLGFRDPHRAPFSGGADRRPRALCRQQDGARMAQWESTRLISVRSLVQSQVRTPFHSGVAER